MKKFLIQLDGYTDHEVEAETKAKATYRDYLSARDALGWSFHDYIIRARVSEARQS